MNDLRQIEDLFPTHGAIEERQQIGRDGVIADLTRRVRDGSDALLLQPRKQGKSSVARAAMDRIAGSGVVAGVDCTSADVYDGPSLARAILAAVRSGGVHLSRLLETRAAVAKQSGRLAGVRRATSTAETSGVGEDEALRVFGSALTALSTANAEPSLDEVLEHLAELGEKRTTALFLDELQELAGWKDTLAVQASLARFMRRPRRKVAVVVAGSEQTATESLFAERRPLHWDFEPLDLPAIDRVDWHAGIHERFESAGYSISSARIDQILAETSGHPLRTMVVAKQTLREARDAGERDVSWAMVDAAIAAARRHPSWRT